MTVVSWAGMRGVVTLAVAAAIPQTLDNGAPFPDRAVIQLMAFVVTIGTLLIQGLTLPALIRRLQAQDPHERERDADAEARIYARSTEAALARLDELRATWPPEHRALLDRIATVVRSEARTVLDAARAREEETAEEAAEEDAAARSTLPAAVHEVRAELLAVQRAVLLDERDGGDVDDEVIRDVLHRLDLEEAALDAGTTQGDV
jgi:CPA1 family monovalent cation:H+ antiporter